MKNSDKFLLLLYTLQCSVAKTCHCPCPHEKF